MRMRGEHFPLGNLQIDAGDWLSSIGLVDWDSLPQ